MSYDPIEAMDHLSLMIEDELVPAIEKLIQHLNPVLSLLASVNDLNSKVPELEKLNDFLEGFDEMVGIQRKALKWQEMFG